MLPNLRDHIRGQSALRHPEAVPFAAVQQPEDGDADEGLQQHLATRASELEVELAEKNQLLADKELEIADIKHELASRDLQLASKDQQLQAMAEHMEREDKRWREGVLDVQQMSDEMGAKWERVEQGMNKVKRLCQPYGSPL